MVEPNWLPVVATSVLPLLLVALALLPDRRANHWATGISRLVTNTLAVQWLVSVLAFAWVGWNRWLDPQAGVSQWSIGDTFRFLPFTSLLRLDGLAAIMLVLISTLAVVIARYSLRYLDGEAAQGRFFRWIAVATGSVSLLVLSSNLALFILFWVATSLSLHQLLVHYRHRPAAGIAAWKKFFISRLGDLCLIIAAVLLWQNFGTLDFQAMFASTAEAIGSAGVQTPVQVAVWLLIAGAATKSAQVPFHTWLPQTMETPTPVSALMHGGIVNAGGYLIIRTSPIVSQVPAALATLAMVGLVTAVFAALVMMTQTNIKRKLAYSTIAQMGFMMLQCGLGAFGVALLHLIAHSVFKANAFLASGELPRFDLADDKTGKSPGASDSVHQASDSSASPVFARPLVSLAIIASQVALILTLLGVFGFDPFHKPGGIVLACVMSISLFALSMPRLSMPRMSMSQSTSSGSGPTEAQAGAMRWGQHLVGRSHAGLPSYRAIAARVVLMVTAYVAALTFVVCIASTDLSHAAMAPVQWAVGVVAILAFVGLAWIQRQVMWGDGQGWLALYVHVRNGFYVDAWLRRRIRLLPHE
ncbi:proton-conducting transporter transmembrane domain-containing protein [Crateriforma conspicua]|uniref:Probable inorganic carbon transporter subunit DabB n=1 Tax=Crateriforma conspicua TaxID=2527996 RepID=A0A5C5Y322_9PLAN|nr:proton-conducting transporter membrane subunit [Crateriforma conspicua]TWT69600.1 NADH-quinone oxidoreductase subunit L [Crateriforma conspicua]